MYSIKTTLTTFTRYENLKIRPAATQGRPAAAPAVEKTAAAGWEELEQTEVQGVTKRAAPTLVRVTMVRVEIHRPGPARNKSVLQQIPAKPRRKCYFSAPAAPRV